MLNRLRPALTAVCLLSLHGWAACRAAADDQPQGEQSPPATSLSESGGDADASAASPDAAKLQLIADPESLRSVIDRARQSVVVITFSGRSEYEQGLGSGFILRKDGLIATNLHVIGEARPI